MRNSSVKGLFSLTHVPAPALDAISYKKPEVWPAETEKTNRWRVDWNEDPRLVE